MSSTLSVCLLNTIEAGDGVVVSLVASVGAVEANTSVRGVGLSSWPKLLMTKRTMSPAITVTPIETMASPVWVRIAEKGVRVSSGGGSLPSGAESRSRAATGLPG